MQRQIHVFCLITVVHADRDSHHSCGRCARSKFSREERSRRRIAREQQRRNAERVKQLSTSFLYLLYYSIDVFHNVAFSVRIRQSYMSVALARPHSSCASARLLSFFSHFVSTFAYDFSIFCTYFLFCSSRASCINVSNSMVCVRIDMNASILSSPSAMRAAQREWNSVMLE
jgi:hypothetical protein